MVIFLNCVKEGVDVPKILNGYFCYVPIGMCKYLFSELTFFFHVRHKRHLLLIRMRSVTHEHLIYKKILLTSVNCQKKVKNIINQFAFTLEHKMPTKTMVGTFKKYFLNFNFLCDLEVL